MIGGRGTTRHNLANCGHNPTPEKVTSVITDGKEGAADGESEVD